MNFFYKFLVLSALWTTTLTVVTIKNEFYKISASASLERNKCRAEDKLRESIEKFIRERKRNENND